MRTSALRVAPDRTEAAGQDHWVLPGLSRQLMFPVIVLIAAVVYAGGQIADGADTVPLCLALLVFGLPHGALDLALIRQDGRFWSMMTLLTVALYLGCALAMMAVWVFNPVVALGIFLALAAVHFAEDWSDAVPPFFAQGTAVALLTAPSLVHNDALSLIFATVTGSNDAAFIATLSILIAPVAMIAAVVGVAIQWERAKHRQAVETGLALGAMLILPPLPAFALFFCLLHSPGQFRHVVRDLMAKDVSDWAWEATALTIASLGIAAVLYGYSPHITLSQGMVASCFMTLSILTLPHIVMPLIMRRIRPLA